MSDRDLNFIIFILWTISAFWSAKDMPEKLTFPQKVFGFLSILMWMSMADIIFTR